jgi:hypothetical protein
MPRIRTVRLTERTEQEGDPYPEWPDDAEVAPGQSEVSFRLAAAEVIKAKGNELFKQASHKSLLLDPSKTL